MTYLGKNIFAFVVRTCNLVITSQELYHYTMAANRRRKKFKNNLKIETMDLEKWSRIYFLGPKCTAAKKAWASVIYSF
jgi:hypothetical protein